MKNKKRSRILLIFSLVTVLMLSVITASVTVYNKRASANNSSKNVAVETQKNDDTTAENDVYRDVELSEEDKDVYSDTSPAEAKEGIEDTDINQEQNVDSNMMINPKEIRYMQSSINNRTGEYTVLGNVEALKNGTLKPTDLALIRLWKDDKGQIWTLDHRRLVAFRMAGLESVPFKWATEEEVESQMWKMTTTTNGESIIMKLGDGKTRIITD